MFATLATLGIAAEIGGPAGGAFWLFLLIPLFWILLFAAIFSIAGRRWRRAGWSHGYGHGYGHGLGHGFGPHGHWGSHAARSAEGSLAERFAQGDIDEKEYRARLEVLRANAYPAPVPPTK